MDRLISQLADWGWAVLILLLGICLSLLRMVRQGDIDRIQSDHDRINIRMAEQESRLNGLLETFHRLELSASDTAAAVKRIASDLESEKDTRDRSNMRILDKLDEITRRIEQRAARIRERGDC